MKEQQEQQEENTKMKKREQLELALKKSPDFAHFGTKMIPIVSQTSKITLLSFLSSDKLAFKIQGFLPLKKLDLKNPQ